MFSKLLHSANLRIPGFALCLGISLIAMVAQAGEEQFFGRPWLEALVLAILLGTAIRTVWQPSSNTNKGIKFCAQTLLEVAIVLLGASLSFTSIIAIGLPLLAGVILIVAVTLLLSFTLGRMLGLSPRLATLIACGNSICGNSAIAAVAPVIGASGEDVATSIAFTAVLGVVVVLALPILVPLLHLSSTHYGIVAGLTVYAVPQVLAATAPVSAASLQIGTLVKLIRVLMLGPVILLMSQLFKSPATANPNPISSRHLLPWFILGFLAMSMLRSTNLIPQNFQPLLAETASFLTILAMAGLGLGVDARQVATAGPRVVATVTLSLIALCGLSLLLIRFL